MSRVKAISGATGQDFEDLKNIAAKMGAETKYTAVEAPEGLQYLAMAGFSVKAQVGSLPAVELKRLRAKGSDVQRISFRIS
ncbi:phage tail tape measure protein [Bacillus velezensis]|nr:phage tail tape measure protein [Bacillus velezensis]